MKISFSGKFPYDTFSEAQRKFSTFALTNEPTAIVRFDTRRIGNENRYNTSVYMVLSEGDAVDFFNERNRLLDQKTPFESLHSIKNSIIKKFCLSKALQRFRYYEVPQENEGSTDY